MPELPEVETTLRGVGPHITGKAVSGVILRESGFAADFAGIACRRMLA